MERQKALSGLILLASMSLLTNACNDDSDTIGTGGAPTAGTAGKGSGGSGSSGKAGQSGVAGEGGTDTAGTAGSSSGSSGSSNGGSGPSDNGGEGGEPSVDGGEGGMPMGGSSGSGGAGSGGTSGGGAGGTNGGGGGTGGAGAGSGGTSGGGGSGGAPPEYCYDHLYIPLGAVGDQADFEVQYPSTIDLSGTVLTVRVRADMAGNGGGFQVYLKNGAAQSYASHYLGWNSLSGLSEWTTLTYDIAAVTPSDANFVKSAVEWVGFNITTGSDFSGAVWDDVDVYVDSMTFSDGASTDLDFNGGVPVLSVNPFNNPVAGAAVSAGICEEDSGSGGAGGGGGAAGSAGTGSGGAGSGGGGAGGTDATGGTGGTDMGASGEAGMGASGEGGMSGAGAEAGMGGADPTGGTGGAGTSGSAGTASGGTAGTGGGPTNLIQNGDFEGGTADWWYSWGTGTFQTSATANSGSYALLVTGRTGSNLNIAQTITSAVSAGSSYAISAYVRTSAPTEGHFTVQIACTGAADEYPWVQGPQALDDTGWTSLTGTLDLSNRCTGGSINTVTLYLEGPDADIDVYMDDVTMTLN